MLPVHEIFESVQGEGFWTGAWCTFIRLHGCPVACSWCDTGYSDSGIKLPRSLTYVDDLVERVQGDRVVITGGEPFIHKELPDLVRRLRDRGKQVAIETSGTFWQELPSTTWITLSPKDHASKHSTQHQFWDRASEVKLVVSRKGDIEFYGDRLATLRCPIYLQPEWNSRATILPVLLEYLKQNQDWKLSLQTHKYLGVQ